ncbi:GtrA family protein [Paraburkholderia sp. NPDC080076]|jgi:putative flippase GtrA|uniref:GtrA family protein n=1 Tax=Paraburkholderia sp. NPDC080076 TaxID=3390605 RepID=UPI003CFE54A0
MRFKRFLVSGAVNTLATYLLYLLLLKFLPYTWAYTVTYVVGIALGYLLSAKWVFKKDLSVRTAASYPVAYLINYAIGLGVLRLCVHVLHVPAQVAPLIVVCVTIPAMFILTRAIFRE